MVFVTLKCGNKNCGKDIVVAFEEKTVRKDTTFKRWICPICEYESPLVITMANK